jgi:hypothetical protein
MLTDVAVRNAKATEKPYKMADGQGLHTPRSGVEHFYNRYAYMDRRREIAQA